MSFSSVILRNPPTSFGMQSLTGLEFTNYTDLQASESWGPSRLHLPVLRTQGHTPAFPQGTKGLIQTFVLMKQALY